MKKFEDDEPRFEKMRRKPKKQEVKPKARKSWGRKK